MARAFKSDMWHDLLVKAQPFNIHENYALDPSFWRTSLNIILARQPMPKCYNAESFFKKYQIRQLSVDDSLKAAICVEIVKLIRKK